MNARISRMAALLCAAMLIIGCGKERRADELVESFLDSCLVDNAISDLSFSPLDSTRHLNDSVIASLRLRLSKSAAFKKGIKYGGYDRQRPLHFITATYSTSDGGKMKQTFYMDERHTAVVCVKNNHVDEKR